MLSPTNFSSPDFVENFRPESSKIENFLRLEIMGVFGIFSVSFLNSTKISFKVHRNIKISNSGVFSGISSVSGLLGSGRKVFFILEFSGKFFEKFEIFADFKF